MSSPQNVNTVGADPALTDVLIELRVDPFPPLSELNITSGALDASRAPAGGFPNSERLSATQGGLILRASSFGDGRFRAGLAPASGVAASLRRYEIALIVETRTPAGE